MLFNGRSHLYFLLLAAMLLAAPAGAQEPVTAREPGTSRELVTSQESVTAREFIPGDTSGHQTSSGQDVLYRVILIGDAGRLLNGKAIVPEAAAGLINPGDQKTAVVFLGDNVYDRGLPDEEDRQYEQSIRILQQQLKPFEDYSAPVYMLPGNHDWDRGGPRGWDRIKRQSAWVDSLPGSRVSFLPSGACPGPVEVDLGERAVLVIVDTQWWLHPFEKPGEESDCECKTRDEVLAALEDIAWRNREKTIIFAAHHAFRSHGIHGGYFKLKQHIFPFTDLNPALYIPLPVIGSIYPLSRGVFGDIQDLQHPEYRYMVNSMEEAVAAAPDVTWVGGHDHALQLIRDRQQYYIVSGSGINTERVKSEDNTLFASPQRGFAEISIMRNGRKQVRFFTVDTSASAHLAYSELLPAPEPVSAPQKPPLAKRESPDASGDSITVAIAPQYDEVGKTHRFFFGDNYRKLWATPVKMRVFRLKEELGGMEIVKKGGGQQTLSLRLADSAGNEWNLRTVQKNPEKALPVRLRATVAEQIVQDQISAAHPFGALAVPVLAAALDIPHAVPELVYLPDDPALGMYRDDFANAVYTFEEREPIPDDTKSTSTVIEKLEDDNDHIVDEKALLKARMLDILIGDWDRHEDQWRWGKIDKDHGNIYYPIPRDRDQVFFTNSGLLPAIAARKWAMPKFQGFKPHIRDVNGFNFNARHFDRRFLHRLEEEDWRQAASLVSETLTDRVLDSALHQMPDTIYRLSGETLLQTLKSRRADLTDDALQYYRFLARAVAIPGSGQPDLFQVTILDKGRVHVRASKVEKTDRVFYERTFEPADTRELWLYGRDNEDVFSVKGAGTSPIKIRMIGGADADTFRVADKVNRKRGLLIYDRSDLDNVYPAAGSAILKTTDNVEVNRYDPQQFQYDRLMPLLTGGYNLDDGIFVGAGFQYVHHGFRKDPYASKNKLLVGHALATKAWFLEYQGEFIGLLGNADLLLGVDAKAPHNTTNFFGTGNETVFDEERSDPAVQHYRTRYDLVNANARLRLRAGESLSWFAGFSGTYFDMKSEPNRGRFITEYAGRHPGQDLFAQQTYAGLTAGFEIDTRNHSLTPTRGLFWRGWVNGMQQLNGENDRYAALQTELSLFTSFNLDPRLVIANRVGLGYVFGNPEFYQLLYLGGKQNLRGYRSYRFAGEGMGYHNIEVRLKLFDFTSYLFPGSVGLTAFHDIGRVWQPGEDSDKWHRGYGGGIYLVPAETLLVNATIGVSEEEVLPSVSLGFQF